jgi:hypothetical protein
MILLFYPSDFNHTKILDEKDLFFNRTNVIFIFFASDPAARGAKAGPSGHLEGFLS